MRKSEAGLRNILAVWGPLLFTAIQACGSGRLLAQGSHDPQVLARHPELFNSKRNDAALLDPKHYHVDFENEQIRVVRCTLPPGDVTTFHHAPASLLVCVKGCDLSLDRHGDALSSETLHLQDGQTKWLGQDDRAERNLGTTTVFVLFVEQKASTGLRR